jgi:hypothetical protein
MGGMMGRISDAFRIGSAWQVVISLSLALALTGLLAPGFLFLRLPNDTFFLLEAFLLLGLAWLLPLVNITQFARESRASPRNREFFSTPRLAPAPEPPGKGLEPTQESISNLPITMGREQFRQHHRGLARLLISLSLVPFTFVFLLTVIPMQLGFAPTVIVVATTLPVWVAAFWYALRNILLIRGDRPFCMDELGITPRPLPIRFIVRGRWHLLYQDVTSCTVVKRRKGWAAGILLNDGSTLYLNERDGIPRSAFEALALKVPTREILLEDVRTRLDSGTRRLNPK